MAKLFANSGDPDQMPCSAASDLGLHCLPIPHLGISRLHWVKKVIGKKCRPRSDATECSVYCSAASDMGVHCLH